MHPPKARDGTIRPHPRMNKRSNSKEPYSEAVPGGVCLRTEALLVNRLRDRHVSLQHATVLWGSCVRARPVRRAGKLPVSRCRAVIKAAEVTRVQCTHNSNHHPCRESNSVRSMDMSTLRSTGRNCIKWQPWTLPQHACHGCRPLQNAPPSSQTLPTQFRQKRASHFPTVPPDGGVCEVP